MSSISQGKNDDVSSKFGPYLLLFNIALEYTIRKEQETTLRLDMDGTYQTVAYVDGVNLIDGDIRTIERKADVLLNVCKDAGSAVNIGKTKYMEVGRHRSMMANEHLTVGNNLHEKVKTLKYLGSTEESKFYSRGNKM